MSDWKTVLICSMVVLVGIFGYMIYLNLRLNKAEKK
ncbi:MAG: CcmD family protein [bacterium]